MYELLPGRACTAYIRVLERMVGEGLFERDAAPQLEDISQFLKSEQDFNPVHVPDISQGVVCTVTVLG